ncbi:hypothetical protein CPC08DRAFT_824513 [Agrocybe pediades]|nr:hypothetical protein CPC08DRAFT_824513 [Agrocybe pediades]
MKKRFDPLIRLPPELWLEIFMKNTEFDDLSHHRLETARHCSQVCQLWRTILLSSSSTWGRLIVLHELDEGTYEWMELMLSRVGNALLWIHGPISSSNLQFFLTVVDRKWENVQFFDVWHCNTGPYLSRETAAYLEKPAPNLEVFTFSRRYVSSPPEQHFNLDLFSKIAPRLRSFDISPFLFDVNSTLPWIPNLHTISFHDEYSRDAIFSVLKAMPRIEFVNIYLRPRTVEPLPRNLAPLHLPRLRGLKVFAGYIPDTLPFLELIKPPDRMCFVVISPGNDHEWNDNIKDLSSRYHDALIPWVLAYLKRCAPTSLYLETYPARCLQIRDYCLSSSLISTAYYKKGSLDVQIFIDGHGHSALSKLGAASGSFSSVEQLLIYGNDQEALIPLYEALASVTELTLEVYAINIPILHENREEKQSVLFPKLRTLRISFEAGPPRDTAYLPQVFDYLECRVRVGLPLSCLDLSDCNPLELSESDRERLGKLTGMSVTMPVASVE